MRVGLLSPRPTLPTRRGVDAILDVGIMRSRRRRSSDNRREDRVKVGREGMAAWIDIDGWFECFDECRFHYPSLHPILLVAKDGDVFLSKVVTIFMSVLHHGRFIVAESVGSGGGVLFKTGCSCSFSFTDV